MRYCEHTPEERRAYNRMKLKESRARKRAALGDVEFHRLVSANGRWCSLRAKAQRAG